MIKRNTKKTARKEEHATCMQPVNVCYITCIKKNYLVYCSGTIGTNDRNDIVLEPLNSKKQQW